MVKDKPNLVEFKDGPNLIELEVEPVEVKEEPKDFVEETNPNRRVSTSPTSLLGST